MPLSLKMPRFAVFMEETNLVRIQAAGIFTYASLIFLGVVKKAQNVRLSIVSKREITKTLIILQCRYPQVCPASQCEAPSPNDCPFLHTCFNFLKSRCKDSACKKGHTLLDRHNQWVISVYGMKKWTEQKLKPLIGLRKIPNNDTKTVSPDEEHNLASDFESFLVMDEARKEDDDNVDVYTGVGHRLQLM